MQTNTTSELVGFVQLQVGSLAVQVPIKAASPAADQPLASFHTEGDAYSIVIRGDKTSKAVEVAMQDAVHDALKHLSKKLLN
jgi:hypothetical protein